MTASKATLPATDMLMSMRLLMAFADLRLRVNHEPKLQMKKIKFKIN